MSDVKIEPSDARHVAANVQLQLHGNVDPDSARTLAARVVHAVDRAAKRGHASNAPTPGEVDRAYAAFARRGVELDRELIREALDAALTRGWGG
jgi:hypothetical protein